MAGSGTVIHCPMTRNMKGIVIYQKDMNDDTIIGYNCEYPNCYSHLCKLPTEYPIGSSLREVQKKNQSSD